MTRFFALICALFLLNSNSVQASGLADEFANYGAVAGAARACKASKLPEFERLTGWIMNNKAKNDKDRHDFMRAYLTSMKKAFNSQKHNPIFSCQDVIKRFNNQPIFDSTLSKDGSVRLPDGKVLKAPKGTDVGDVKPIEAKKTKAKKTAKKKRAGKKPQQQDSWYENSFSPLSGFESVGGFEPIR